MAGVGQRDPLDLGQQACDVFALRREPSERVKYWTAPWPSVQPSV